MSDINLPVLFGAILAGAVITDYGVKNLKASTKSTASSTASSSGSVPASGGQQHGLVSTAALQAVGAMHGWSGQQISDWMNVVQAESNGTLTDTNPSSGAYGIAQFINGPNEYYTYHGDPTTLTGQLTAMANYIAERYGNPSSAWAHEQANRWY